MEQRNSNKQYNKERKKMNDNDLIIIIEIDN